MTECDIEKEPHDDYSRVATPTQPHAEQEQQWRHDNASPQPTIITRVLSRASHRAPADPGPPPDGGARAWATACVAHLVIFNIWGFVNSFGLFQTYYVETMQIGGPSSVAWIGTTQTSFLFGLGAFSGRGLDAGLFRVQNVLGSVIYVVGTFMLSLCKSYWQIFLAQAVCCGIGFGLVFVPSIGLVSTYFLEKRSTALGIVVTGSATGGLVFPAIAESMLPRVGFGWTVRTMAFVQLALAVVSCALLKPRLPPRKSGPIVEVTAFKEAPYTLYLIASFLFFWAVYVGFYFVGSFATNALKTDQSTAINLLMVINGIGIPARLIPAYIAQSWTGALNLLIPIVVLIGVVLYSWIAVTSVAGLWLFAVFYGLGANALQAMFPVVLTSLTKDPAKQGVRTGMGFSLVGFAVLTGPPIAGALLEKGNGNYLGLQLFSGTSMLAAAVVLLCTRFAAVGWHRVKI